MGSMLHTLRDMAANPETPVDDIVDKALLQATVLQQKAIQAWLRRERDGYGDDENVPDYRRGEQTTLIAWRPGSGWVEAPISDQQAEKLAAVEVRTDIPSLVRSRAEIRKYGGRREELDESYQLRLRKEVQLDTRLAVVVSASAYERILDTVRLGIRIWTDRLLDAGIEGHGSAFTREEKALARPVGEELDAVLAEATAEQAELPTPSQPGLIARLLGRA